MNEKEVQQATKKLLGTLGFFVSDFSQPRRTMQTPGVPDLHCMHRTMPWTFWVECKAEGGGRLSQDQTLWHDTARLAGETVYVVESAGQLWHFIEEEYHLRRLGHHRSQK